MPVWQHVYEEINDPNFVIISAAQDTGGEAVAGPVFDAASPTYVQIVDVNHTISAAFNFVNVPSAAWIDETGKIVRVDEGAYAKVHPFGGTDIYVPAVKDWVKNGADSKHVKSSQSVTNDIRVPTPEQQKAEAAFRLGNLFREFGHAAEAERFWAMAIELHPDNVNYVRQNLTLSEDGSAGVGYRKLREEFESEGKDYYRPLDIESK